MESDSVSSKLKQQYDPRQRQPYQQHPGQTTHATEAHDHDDDDDTLLILSQLIES